MFTALKRFRKCLPAIVATWLLFTIAYLVYQLPSSREAHAIEQLRAFGCVVQTTCPFPKSIMPEWMVKRYERAIRVRLPVDFGDANVVLLNDLEALKYLSADQVLGVTDRMFEILAPSEHLVGLEASFMFVSDEAMTQLSKWPRLQELCIRFTQVSDTGVEKIVGSLPLLKRLDMTGCRISIEAVQSMSELRQLESLFVSGESITDESLEYLCELPSLQVLYLDGTAITEDAIPIILQMHGLREISLVSTNIPFEVVDELQRTRPELRINR